MEQVLGQKWKDARMPLGDAALQVDLTLRRPVRRRRGCDQRWAERRGHGAERCLPQTDEQGRDTVILQVGDFFLVAGED